MEPETDEARASAPTFRAAKGPYRFGRYGDGRGRGVIGMSEGWIGAPFLYAIYVMLLVNAGDAGELLRRELHWDTIIISS